MAFRAGLEHSTLSDGILGAALAPPNSENTPTSVSVENVGSRRAGSRRLAAKLDTLAGESRNSTAETGEIAEEGVRIVSEGIGANASETSSIECESIAEEITSADTPVDPRLDALLSAARRGVALATGVAIRWLAA